MTDNPQFDPNSAPSGGADLGNATASFTLDIGDLSSKKDTVVASAQAIEDAFNSVGQSVKENEDYFASATDQIDTHVAHLQGLTGGLRAIAVTMRELKIPGAQDVQMVSHIEHISNLVDMLSTHFETLAESLEKGEGFLSTFADAGAKLATTIPGVSEGVGALVGALAPFAIAIGVGAVALNTIHTTLDGVNDAAKTAEGALDEYYKLLAAHDSPDKISKDLKSLNDQLKNDQDELSVRLASQGNAFNAASQAYGDFGARILTMLSSTGLYGDTAKDNNAEIQKLQDNIKKLTGDIQGASSALTSQQVISQGALQALSEATKQQDEYNKLIQTGSVKSVTDLIDANKAKIQSDEEAVTNLNALKAAGTVTQSDYTDTMKQYHDEINKLKTDNDALTASVLPVVTNTENAKKSLDELNKSLDSYNKTLKEAAGVQAQLDDLKSAESTQIKATFDERQATLAQQELDYETKITQEKADFYSNQADQDAQYYEQRSEKVTAFQESQSQLQDQASQKRLDVIASSNQAQVDAAIALSDNISKILRDARNTELDEAGTLDARRLAQTQRQTQTKLDDTQSQYERETQKRQQAEQKQLDNLEKSTDQQIQKQQEAFERSLALEDKHHEESDAKAEEAFDKRLKQEDKQYQTQQDKQTAQWTKQDEATVKHYLTERDKLQSHLSDLEETLIEGQTNMYNTVSAYIGPGGVIPQQFQAGFAQIQDSMQNAFIAAQNTFNGQASMGGGQTSQQSASTPAPVTSTPTTSGTSVLGSILTGIGGLFGFAGGGTPPAGQPVLVGERGPELAVFPSNTSIYNNQDTKNMLGGNQTHITVNIDGKGNVSGMDKENLKNILADIIENL